MVGYPQPQVSFEDACKSAACGIEWISSGKEHRCSLDGCHYTRCLCDCGEKSPKQRLSKFQFTPKKSNTQLKRERRALHMAQGGVK